MTKETLENHGMLVKGHNGQREKKEQKERTKHSIVKRLENVETTNLILWYLYLG